MAKSPRTQVSRRFLLYGTASLLGLVLVSGANPPSTPQQSSSSAPPAAVASPLDEPLRIIQDARQSYRGVRDYTCTLIKREHIDGRLQPDNVIAMKVRAQPFSVYLHWKAPKEFAGQEACYVAGRNNGKMRALSPGILGVVGFVSVDPNDERVRKNSRRSITDAGIGNLIERFAGYYEKEKELKLTQVRIAEYEYSKRRCIRVETIHPDNRGGHFASYRSVLYFDKENRLPIRLEAYDWPRPGGPPDGELIEVYSYVNLRLNVGLGDDAFDY